MTDNGDSMSMWDGYWGQMTVDVVWHSGFSFFLFIFNLLIFSYFWVNAGPHKPTNAHKSQRRSMRTNSSQHRPMRAHESQQGHVATDAGQWGPTKVCESQQGPMEVPKSQCRPCASQCRPTRTHKSQHRPAKTNSSQHRPTKACKANKNPWTQKSPKANAGQQGPMKVNKDVWQLTQASESVRTHRSLQKLMQTNNDPWKPTKVGPNDARCIVWALCKFFFFLITNVLLYIRLKVQNTQWGSPKCTARITGARDADASQAWYVFYFILISYLHSTSTASIQIM